jgi:hypothetical protein
MRKRNLSANLMLCKHSDWTKCVVIICNLYKSGRKRKKREKSRTVPCSQIPLQPQELSKIIMGKKPSAEGRKLDS